MLFVCSLFLITTLAVGCSPKETPEQKLEAFKAAHKAMYNAWATTTKIDMEDALAKGMLDPFLKEQITQQNSSLQQRLAVPERHNVHELIYNQLELVDEDSESFTVYADWTVKGEREHGDVHPIDVTYKKQFHLVKDKAIWKIDQMTDAKK